MSMKAKLNRFKKDIVKDEAKKEATNILPLAEDLIIPHLEKWKSIGAEPFYFDDSYCFVRRVEYPLDYQHGLYQFGELIDIVSKWNDSRIDHPLSSKGLSPNHLFFFDTETTGLGGGAGNTIFLLGHARLEQDRIVVVQHFLPNPGSEVPLYQSFLSSVDYKTLVTYNGKSFDWPQVKTRHTLIRDSLPNLPEFGHFDLYHASRRLWKSKLQSVKLAKVEKEILDIQRDGDIPGFLAPMLYFDFIEHKDPEGIIGVLKHNEIDVLSLLTLYIHLSKKILEVVDDKNEHEQYEVARWLNTLGEVTLAEDVYQRVAQQNNAETVKAKLALAFIYKKKKEYDQVVRELLEVYNAGTGTELVTACIELAKVYEHREKDYQKALFFTKEANKHLSATKIEQYEVDKRLKRLMKKCQNKHGIFPGEAQK